MPRFHFHIEGQDDSDGIELSSLPVAKCQAIKLAGQSICDDADKFWDKAEWAMTVTDEVGLTLFQLRIIGTEAASIQKTYSSDWSSDKNLSSS